MAHESSDTATPERHRLRTVLQILKGLLAVTAFAVVAFFAWNILAGPLKYKRDINAFAASLGKCMNFSRAIRMPVGGPKLDYAVEGLRNNRCSVRIETLGPHVLHCAFPAEAVPGIAQAFADAAENVGIFGATDIRISTSNPDPLTRALNSDSCEARID